MAKRCVFGVSKTTGKCLKAKRRQPMVSDAKHYSDLARRVREAKRRDREGLSGGLFTGQISPWVASAAALAGGVLVFNLVRFADPNADTR